MTTYEERLSLAKDIISKHNEVCADNQFNIDEFFKALRAAGGTSAEALKLCQWEDLEKLKCPTLLAKQIVSVFRSKEEEKRPTRVITEARSQSMSIRELLEVYDFRNFDNFVGKRLRELSEGKPCLVFKDNGTLNVDASEILLTELREGYKQRENFIFEDRPYPIFTIGEHPDQYAHENPLFPGELLRMDETCDSTNRSWRGVSEEVRILLHLAVKNTKELKVDSVDQAHQAMDLVANSKEPTSTVRRRYPKASIVYDQFKAEGTLPSLRLRKSRQSAGKRQDPFFQHKTF